MRSIGIDLGQCIEKGSLLIHSSRPMIFGLEMHLMEMRKMIDDFGASVVIIDPISNLITWHPK
jgi:circadian clock protein KaiC